MGTMGIMGIMPPAMLLQAAPAALLQEFTVRRLGATALTLLVAWLLIRWSARAIEAMSRRNARARFVVKWIQPILRIGIWLIALLICTSLLAPSRETFLAGVASIGIALGLGAQDLVKNLIGGLVVLADRPYQLGDRVQIGDAIGEIDHIGLRSTKLMTLGDTRVTIPNTQIMTEQVFNSNSGVPECQVATDLFLPPDTDPDLACAIGREAAICSPFFFSAQPVVVLATHVFDRQVCLRLRIKCYVHDHRFVNKMESDITVRASRELLRHGVLQAWRSPAAPAAPAEN